MRLSTKIRKLEMKQQIIEAMEPLLHQVILPFNGEEIDKAYDTFFKELDKILKIK